MESLQDLVRKYYMEQGYNCAETLIHAGNEYYNLHLHEDDMKMMAGFGGGMFVGSTCGALVGSVATISKLVIKTKAHDQMQDIRPVVVRCNQHFREVLGATDCAHVKARHHSKEIRCLNTCLLASQVLEDVLKEFNIVQ